ncbi:MAG: YitT family protein [Oscillospiraceae bacterium]|nr:YitT family protein [Oscillospiraceae bacterium]
MLHKALQNRWTRLIIGIIGTFINAFGVNYFIVPMGLFSGGILGVSQLLRTFIASRVALPAGVDIAGALYLLLNLPLILLAWKALGRVFVVRTLICTLSSSFFYSILTSPATPILEERIACCLVGGIIGGFGLGLTLTSGCSSGGLDILGLWLTKRGSHFTVGRFSVSFNAVLYSICAIVFNVQTALYSVIYNVISSFMVDRAHQQGITVQLMIFTRDEDPELPQHIMRELNRGVTYWEGMGAYTGKPIRVMCVAVSKFEVEDLRRIVTELDPHAFFIVQEGVRIEGNFIRKIG